MTKSIAAFFMGFFLVFSAEASMISFFVIETGLPQEGAINQHSLLWENTLLDVFFNEGHIVCNFPIMRFEEKPEGEILQVAAFDIKEAMDVGIDYLILAQLNYVPDSQMPGEILFFIYRITPHEKIYEKRITGKAYRSRIEEVNDLKLIVRELIPYFGS